MSEDLKGWKEMPCELMDDEQPTRSSCADLRSSQRQVQPQCPLSDGGMASVAGCRSAMAGDDSCANTLLRPR